MTTAAKEETHSPSLADAVGERAKAYVAAGVDAVNAVTGKTRQIGRQAGDCVRSNPWLALGAAAGVGILIGYMLRGRRES